MQQRGEPSLALLRLAAAQADVVTREQALGLDLSRHTLARLVDQDRWRRLGPGLFVVHNSTVEWQSLAWAGVLLGGSGSRIAGTAAAHAHGLVDEAPDPVTVLVPHGAHVRSRAHWSFVQERPGARSSRSTGSPPRTLLPDTLLDLCEGASPRAVEDLVTRAVQRRLTTPQHLHRALVRRTRHSRRSFLAALLHEVAEGAESPLELRYLRAVERAHGLPPGLRQGPSRDRSAWRDVLYEPYGLVVELDGRRGHEGVGAFRDMRRDNAALLQRLATLRYGHGDVWGRPCAVAREVATVLRSGGWTGFPTACRRCSTRSEAE